MGGRDSEADSVDGGGSEVDGGRSEVDGGGEVRLYHDTNRLVKVSTASTVDVLVGSTPRHGCWPASSLNGVRRVAAWTLLLYMNSTSGSQSAQSSCRWLTKTRR